MLPPPPSSMRAAATTPAEPVGVRVVRFPTDGSLPRRIGGSASASAAFGACSAFTRVAARMVAEPPRAALLSKCFRRFRYLHHPLQLLPAGTTVAGRALHPLGDGAFPRRTMRVRIHPRMRFAFAVCKPHTSGEKNQGNVRVSERMRFAYKFSLNQVSPQGVQRAAKRTPGRACAPRQRAAIRCDRTQLLQEVG